MDVTLVVVGDALLDRDLEGAVRRLSPDAPVPVVDDPEERARPGGAALAAVLASTDGRSVRLVTALADDDPGRELRGLLDAHGVEVVDLGLDGSTPEKVRIRSAGRSLLRLDRGGAPGRVGPPSAEADAAITDATAILVSDYGRGVADRVRGALRRAAGTTSLVWDPHPRGREPVPDARLVTPNRDEAARFAPEISGDDLGSLSMRARALATRWRAAGVVVTLGDRGALYVAGDGLPMIVPARRVPVGDPCGAGDRFAVAAAGVLADGGLPSEAVTGAVASAAEFVAAGGASSLTIDRGSPAHRSGEEALVAAVRARGGTVVATSGCFDLLHAGHVATLESARALGDCLIVCLNSDESIRRLKGPDRPVVGVDDRAAVLRSLACVDEVVVFDEDTPEAALSRLRPDVFAKGGDYAMAELPEAALVESWGGQAVILPYVAGRSTTGLMEEVVRRGAS
ncbi:MAG TPA: D-glycero-beta-D-manno-heptose 1-phosphate adenylyltransferase [Actinomycetota bacterium]|nr:D-glycero-beta-D-manno-heptose 1-phosphate adenylyltransferase [Actinomycetota bacterium]